MIKYIHLIAIAVGIASISSCTKDAAKTTSSHYISASTSASTTFAASDPRIAGVNNGSLLNMKGSQTSGACLGFIFPKTLGVHNIDTSTCMATYASYPLTVGGASVHGTITLTALSPDLIGTFNFTCVDSTVVTGSFDMAAP